MTQIEKENKCYRYGKDKDNLVVDVVRHFKFFNFWMTAVLRTKLP
jgi:hypothetical protein